jgi:HNH endonuclease/AP2 domain/NUMOD4 motif
MKELWKQIAGFPGYQVSNHGVVAKSVCDRTVFMKGSTNGRGYRRVRLKGPGVERRVLVSRLVAEHFLPPPGPGQSEVDHINGDTDDNSSSNLRWASRRENNRNKPFGGVWFWPERGKWQVQIRTGQGNASGPGRKVTVGYFQSEKEARKAYARARLEHHGEFACGS